MSADPVSAAGVHTIGSQGSGYAYATGQLLIDGQVMNQGPFEPIADAIILAHVQSQGKRSLVLRNYRQPAYYDTASRQLAWEALTCVNPACPRPRSEAPFVFYVTNSNVRPDEKGQVDFSTVRKSSDPEEVGRCPACGRVQHVVPYATPEVLARRQELMKLKQAIRALRRSAKSRGEPIPSGLRTPADIDREIAALPQIYLLPDQSNSRRLRTCQYVNLPSPPASRERQSVEASLWRDTRSAAERRHDIAWGVSPREWTVVQNGSPAGAASERARRAFPQTGFYGNEIEFSSHRSSYPNGRCT